MYVTPPAQTTNETKSEPAPQLAPSAAGPVLNASIPDNSTADVTNGMSDSQSVGKPDLKASGPSQTQEDNSTVVRAAVSEAADRAGLKLLLGIFC